MSFRKEVIEGLTWSGLAQAGKQVCQLAITTILARILAPQEFGLMAMATVFIGFATSVSEMGIGNALVQRKEIGEEHRSSAFWLNMALGALLMLLTLLVSPAVAAFYRRPELVPILNVLSVTFLISSAGVVPQSLLMRGMDFRSLMIRDLAAMLLSGGIGITLAVKGYGVWSLVHQMLAWAVFSNLLLWPLSGWRPRLSLSRKGLADLIGFGSNVTAFQLVNYLARNVDQLLIGRLLGAQSLGYYAMAYKLMLLPVQNISWVITRVMFPAFSRIQGDLARVADHYARMVSCVSLATFPMMMFFSIVAPDLIHLLWGGRWDEIVPIVRVLCLCGMIQSIVSVGGPVYLSQGRADLQFRMSLANAALTTLCILIGLRWSIFGVAVAYTSFNLLWAPFSIHVVTKILRCDSVPIFRLLARNVLAALIPFVVLLGLKRYLSLEPGLLISTLVLTGGVVYLSSLLLLKRIGVLSW